MKWIMRYNDWQHDPLSLGDPGNSVCSRFDLETSGASPAGGLDSKVTNSWMMSQFTAQGISGPTYYQQEVFEWSNWESYPHYGQPNKFNFDWQTFSMQNV